MKKINGRGHTMSADSITRRTFLYGSAGAGLVAGLGSLPHRAFAADGLLALVHTQHAGDNGPVDSMIAALKKLGSEKGMKTRAIDAADPAAFESIFKNLGDAGASVVTATFLEVAEAMKAVAPKYPKTKFVQIFADPIDPPVPNIRTVSYNYYLGAYIAGYFGAKWTKNGKLGYIGGVSLPPLNADFNAFKAGALAANPNATAVSAFAGSFQDPTKGHEIAAQMYGSGVEYIFTDGAATDAGVIKAATEGEDRYTSSISPAQYKLGPKAVAVLTTLDFGMSLYRNAVDALSPDFKGGHYATGLNDGVIDFIASDEFQKSGPPDAVAKMKALWPEIDKLKKDIISGTLKVPFDTKL
jgi:basic membrane protein A